MTRKWIFTCGVVSYLPDRTTQNRLRWGSAEFILLIIHDTSEAVDHVVLIYVHPRFRFDLFSNWRIPQLVQHFSISGHIIGSSGCFRHMRLSVRLAAWASSLYFARTRVWLDGAQWQPYFLGEIPRQVYKADTNLLTVTALCGPAVFPAPRTMDQSANFPSLLLFVQAALVS